MAETKEDIAAQRDQLQAENEQLRGQLAAAASRPGPVTPTHTFQLTQGHLVELETYGVTNINGRQYTTDEVRAKLTGDQAGLHIEDASNPVTAPERPDRPPVAGVDYTWPSVAPGEIDPAVAGTPGISGPAAGSEQV